MKHHALVMLLYYFPSQYRHKFLEPSYAELGGFPCLVKISRITTSPMRIWIDPQITLELIRESPLQERLLQEFSGAKGLGLNLFYPIALDESGIGMETKTFAILSACGARKHAWKFIRAPKGLTSLGGAQSVGAPGDYTIAIDRGDLLSMLASAQTEICDVHQVEAEVSYLYSRWESANKRAQNTLAFRASAMVAWVFARAYRADAIYTRSADTAASLDDIFRITGTNISVLHSTTPIGIKFLKNRIHDATSAAGLLVLDAFARRFGEVAHTIIGDMSASNPQSIIIRGQLTSQPTFGASFEAKISPTSQDELLPALIENQLLSGMATRADIERIIERLDELATILLMNDKSLQEITEAVSYILRKMPESRSLFEDLVNGATSSLIAENIIEAIKLAIGR